MDEKTTNKFKKIIKYITMLSFVCLVFAGSCTGCHSSVDVISDLLPKKKKIPTESFVKIGKFATISKCVPVSGTNCKEGTSFKSSASGAIIASDNRHGSFILTAAHVCDVSAGINKASLMIQELKFSIKLTSIYADEYDAYIVATQLEDGIDLCLLHAPSMKKLNAIKIASKGPEIGDLCYNIAAPGGIFHPPAVPILAGYYSGYMSDLGSAMYTIPAIGGSSGSPILNSRYELIGNVFAASTIYTHMTLSTTHENIISFLKEAFDIYAKKKHLKQEENKNTIWR